MELLQQLNEEMINLMKKTPGVLGAWEFGSGMHHTRDEYSDIDIVFLLQSSEYDTISQCLPDLLETICDQVLIFWPEDFNGVSMKNFDCLLEREGQILQYDIFLLNDAALDDGMCKIHYADLKRENIFFDPAGKVAALIHDDQIHGTWSDDIFHLIDTYWLHIHMSSKYFLRGDYFKLEGVLRLLMDTHASLLLTAYDRTTWGGAANKLHYLPKEKQKHLQYYYCDNDLDKTAQNLHQSMLWFEEDVLELDTTEAGGQNQINSEKSQSHGPWDEKFHCTYAKIKKAWEKMMDITS